MAQAIEVMDDPGPEIRQAILAPLLRFNRQQTGSEDRHRPLALTIPGAAPGEIAGGLWGASGWGHLHIELVFVPEAMRGKGVGRALMIRAEEEAIRRSCHRIWLDTFSFQAPGFYEALGYAAFGALDAYPAGHRRIFLCKTIA